MEWFIADRLFDGSVLRKGMALGVEADRVCAIAPADEYRKAAHRIPGLVTPGFVDLQVNGGGGVLFNANPTLEGLAAIAAAHRAAGTVAILPTVITDAIDVLACAVEVVIAARSAKMPGLIGLHIEGPHIDRRRRGTHDARFVRPMDDSTLGHVRRLRDRDIPVMITLAPEAATPDQIATLAGTGAVVSLGHSDAAAPEVEAALAAGARCFTHLFNAMSQMQGRAPGMVGTAINSTAHVGMICDGIHVDDRMLALAIRARPVPRRCFCVSDAMPTVGGPDSFKLYGQEIRVADGRLINAEGNLAGAHVTMAQSLRHLVKNVGIDLEEALAMATGVPMALIRPDRAAPMLVGMESTDVLIADDSLGAFTPMSEWSG